MNPKFKLHDEKNYMICVHKIKKKSNVGEFGNEPGTATFLEIPYSTGALIVRESFYISPPCSKK
ncbi:MAG: hypothetical protein JWO44_413 [Bacteroidetes bacterium]|nr:hypothetical protein [Bacteroidota bacterium]